LVTSHTQIKLYFEGKCVTTYYNFGTTKQISITRKFVREGIYVGIKCKCTFSGQKKSIENAGFEICCSF
jgi:hypothetical protein